MPGPRSWIADLPRSSPPSSHVPTSPPAMGDVCAHLGSAGAGHASPWGQLEGVSGGGHLSRGPAVHRDALRTPARPPPTSDGPRTTQRPSSPSPPRPAVTAEPADPLTSPGTCRTAPLGPRTCRAADLCCWTRVHFV